MSLDFEHVRELLVLPFYFTENYLPFQDVTYMALLC